MEPSSVTESSVVTGSGSAVPVFRRSLKDGAIYAADVTRALFYDVVSSFEQAKDAVEITVPSGSTATFAIGTVGHCCMWKTGTGVMDPDGHTLHVDATG